MREGTQSITVDPKRVRKKQHWQVPPVTRVRVRERIRRWQGYIDLIPSCRDRLDQWIESLHCMEYALTVIKSAPDALYSPRVTPRNASEGARRAHLAIAQQWSANHRNSTRAGVYPPRRSIKIIFLSLITVSSFKRASKICDFWKATAETKLLHLLLDNSNRAIPHGWRQNI